MRLFTMISDLPTIFEVLSRYSKKLPSEKTPSSLSRSTKPPSKKSKSPHPKQTESSDEEDYASEHENSSCGACGKIYISEEFWICCDTCDRWFHGICVKVTPAIAEHIKYYMCPECRYKRRRE